MLIKSLYLSEEVPGAKTVDAFWREDLNLLRGAEGYRKRRAFLRGLAHLLSSLHQKRIYHNDFNASNILIRDGQGPIEGHFSVIDLQGLRKCFYVSGRRRIKNLAQLDRTLGRLLTRTEKLYFLKAYGGSALFRSKSADLVNVILEETRRQRARSLTRSLVPSQRRLSPAGIRMFIHKTRVSSFLFCNRRAVVGRRTLPGQFGGEYNQKREALLKGE
jgi:tRNA A-37 threonylcarbamoyl transferase component Bud32